MITVNIDRGTAAGSMGPTSTWCDGQRQAQPPPQSETRKLVSAILGVHGRRPLLAGARQLLPHRGWSLAGVTRVWHVHLRGARAQPLFVVLESH